MNTAAGSPSRRAIVSISFVVLRTVPPTWSTRTRTSLMFSTSESGIGAGGSDELLRRQEVNQRLGAAAVVVGDDLALAARRPLLGALHGGVRRVQPDVLGVDADVAQRPRLDRLLLRGHDPLEGGIARLAGLVGDGGDEGQRALDGDRRGVAVTADLELVAVGLDRR